MHLKLAVVGLIVSSAVPLVALHQAAADQPNEVALRLVVQLAHKGGVRSIAFNPNGLTVASGGTDGTIKLWTCSDGQLLRTFPPDRLLDEISSVAFSPDGQTIAGGGDGDTVNLWSTLDGHLKWSLLDTGDVNSVAFSPDGTTVAAGSSDGMIMLWSATTGQAIHRFSCHMDDVNSIAFSPDGSAIACGGERALQSDGFGSVGIVTVLSSVGGQVLRTLLNTGESNSVNSLAFSPAGSLLTAGTEDGALLMWSTSDGRLMHTVRVRADNHPVKCVAFSPDSQTVVTGGDHGEIDIINVATGLSSNFVIANAATSVTCLAFSPTAVR